MINPTRDDIGRLVIYSKTSESGVITSFNDFYVFVRYGAEPGSKGTQRRDLDWLSAPQLPEVSRSSHYS